MPCEPTYRDARRYQRQYHPLTVRCKFSRERLLSFPPPSCRVTFPIEDEVLESRRLPNVNDWTELSVRPRVVSKPDGEAGRPGRGGYILKEVLATEFGWDDTKYAEVQGFVRELTKKHLKTEKTFTKQSPTALAKVYKESKAKYPVLNLLDNDWAVRDFIKMHLKNTSHQVKLKEKVVEAESTSSSSGAE